MGVSLESEDKCGHSKGKIKLCDPNEITTYEVVIKLLRPEKSVINSSPAARPCRRYLGNTASCLIHFHTCRAFSKRNPDSSALKTFTCKPHRQYTIEPAINPIKQSPVAELVVCTPDRVAPTPNSL